MVDMTTNWVLNVVGLFLTTVGALLTLLYLSRSPRFAEDWLSPEGKKAYAKHRRSLIIAVGLLAACLILQYLAAILI
jgi:hypothetical protein